MKKHLLLTLGLALASPVLLAQNSGSSQDEDKSATPAQPATPAIPGAPSKDNTAIEGPSTNDEGQTSGSARSGKNSAGATGNPNTKSAKTRTRGGGSGQFGTLDLNGDKKISQDELAVDTKLSARFKEADSNSDGSLNQGEFSKLEDKAKESGGKDTTTEPRTEGSDRTDKDDELNRKLGGG